MKKYIFLPIIITAAFFFFLPAAQAQDWLRAEVEAFKRQDAENGTTSGGILFLGSSSIRMWDAIGEYFPGYPIVKRGFGGSSMRHAVYYFDDLVRPHNPSQIILYFGENDLNGDYPVDDFMKDAECFVRMVQIIFPETKMSFISIKPSPSRRKYFDKFMEANRRLSILCESTPGMSFIDVWSQMSDCNNRLRDTSTFLDDSLHMTPKGYEIWKKEITPHLLQFR